MTLPEARVALPRLFAEWQKLCTVHAPNDVLGPLETTICNLRLWIKNAEEYGVHPEPTKEGIPDWMH